MDQAALNQIATDYIASQSWKVSKKLQETLGADFDEHSEELPGQLLHHIHNMSLFDCLVWLNSFAALNDAPKEALDEYLDLAETLKGKFIEIVNELKDFKVTD